eukprot:TRINITY_DN60528_c0_g1_i7.p1 TRINITY_DN60528_c0_g1~~TRINITY_DN60528_c0_g1_i7.p1  ORF type:complete len:258 (+),score=51.37 TRINITY_DN60528_c0_g1_i7:148-921(+)
MGPLSPELQVYAENIWRRFPEVFISLGAPDACIDDEEDVDDDGEGRRRRCWHRVRDTCNEKVIEVVLPKRSSQFAETGSSFRQAAERPQQQQPDRFCPPGRTLPGGSNPQGSSRRSNGGLSNVGCLQQDNGALGAGGRRLAGSNAAGAEQRRNAHLELQALQQVVMQLTESLPTSVSREVRSQIHYMKRRLKSDHGDRSTGGRAQQLVGHAVAVASSKGRDHAAQGGADGALMPGIGRDDDREALHHEPKRRRTIRP